MLVSHNSDCNFQSCTGDSPLHYAAGKGDFFIVKLLIENGALVHLTNQVRNMQLGLSPVDLAVDAGFKDCIEIFKQFAGDNCENTTKKRSEGSMDFRFSMDQDYKAVYLTSKSEDVSEIESSPHVYELFNTFGGLTSALQESKKTEKILLFDWLGDNGLTELFDVLVDSGYDDHIVMARQMLTTMPIKMKNLAEIGIAKTGHQRRLLFCLEEEGKNRRSLKRESLKNRGEVWRPVGKGGEVGGVGAGLELRDVLRDLRMENFFENFVETGHDDYFTIARMSRSKWALNEQILKDEMKIYDWHEIQRFLERVQRDSGGSRGDTGILFEEPKNVACSKCDLM